MFANVTKFRAVSPRRAATSPIALACSDDNGSGARGAMAARQTRRPVLACRWRPIGGGGLECRWHIEIADGSATEEPDGRWLIRRICRLLGIELVCGRHALPANG